jgi:hypothetical protein
MSDLTGVELSPGTRGWSRREGEGFVRINSQGLRDEEHEFAKPPSTYRIAILGDSYAEASQVDADETFWSVMERELSQCESLSGKTVETINFGVSGFGTAQELLTLRHRAWRYDPDMVLVAFVSNDVRNNSRQLQGDPSRPYFLEERDGLVLDDSFLTDATFERRVLENRSLRVWLRNRLRIVQLAYAAKDALHVRRKKHGILSDRDGVFGPPANEDLEVAWRVTEALLLMIAQETWQRGADFLLAVVSESRQVHPDPDVRRRIAEQIGITDYFYFEDRLQDFAKKVGIESIGLGRILRAEAEDRAKCHHGFDNAYPCYGHWNQLGHEVAGVHISRSICSKLARKPSQVVRLRDLP